MMMACADRCLEMPSRKASLILEAAFELFLARGFDPVSTDLIAKTAGVSKVTVYAHFDSKEALFAQSLRRKCAEISDRIRIPDQYSGDKFETLRCLALSFVSIFQDDSGVAMYRLVVGEIHRFPQIALAFDAAGPSEMRGRLVRLLGQIVERGELKIDDLDLACDQFMALLTGRILLDRALGLPMLPQAEIHRRVDAAIGLFLKGYEVE